MMLLLSSGAVAGCSDDGVPAAESTATAGASTSGNANESDPTAGQPTTASDSDGLSTGAESMGTSGVDTDPSTDPTDATDSSTDTDGTASTGGSGSGTGTGSGSSSGTGSSSGSSGSSSTGGGFEIGEDCKVDDECASGVCWNFNDYDKACFGAVCSTTCENTKECQDAFADAGAPTPEGVTCGGDMRCDPIGSGFGAFGCASK